MNAKALKLFFSVSLLVGFCSPSSASRTAMQFDKRLPQSMEESVNAAETVLVGTFDQEGQIKVSEVLKGDKNLLGQTVRVRPEPPYSPCMTPTPPGGVSGAVLLAKNWQKSNNRVIDQYVDADRVSCLRCLIPIYALTSERERLKRLAELCLNPTKHCMAAFGKDPTPIFRSEFYASIPKMRDPANFEIVTELYPKVSPDAQIRLLDWMGDTEDKRAVPILLAACHSSNKTLREQAMLKLRYYFPDQAIPQNAKDTPPKQTAFQEAEILKDAGKPEAAVPKYMQAIEDHSASPYIKRYSALAILKYGDVAQKARVKKAVFSLVKEDATQGNYLELCDAAEILRKLHDMECLDSLITILNRHDFLFLKSNRIATAAILDLGPKARTVAISALLNQIDHPTSDVQSQENKITLLIELAFLATASDIDRIDQKLAGRNDWLARWKEIRPLAGVSDSNDQESALLNLLQRSPQGASDKSAWIAFRLGDLRSMKSADALVCCLVSGQYELSTASQDALKSIGSGIPTKGLEDIALDPDGRAQVEALDILCTIYGEKELPLLRRIIQGGQTPAKSSAILWMGRLGKPEDLKFLTPMAEYWTGDRANHYWLIQAISGINQRTRKS